VEEGTESLSSCAVPNSNLGKLLYCDYDLAEIQYKIVREGETGVSPECGPSTADDLVSGCYIYI